MNSYKAKNTYYDKISKKVEDGIFVKGKSYRINECFDSDKIKQTPVQDRTRDFYLNNFQNDTIFDYIKNHIGEFDRQFFKDLIETNVWATKFENNCFAVMPLDYIDEEMCSLAILKFKNWYDYNWFYSVYERKPEALSEDLWKLGARLYARVSEGENKFLNITPGKYKDSKYFIEMCSCNYNGSWELDGNKGKIMDTIPQEILTPEFLIDLLVNDINSVSRFNEMALETIIYHTVDGKMIGEKVWQFVVRIKGDTIRSMALNDERVEFFLKHYAKDSSEYIRALKDKYKRYLKKQRDAEALALAEQRTQDYAQNTARMVLSEIQEGKNPTNVIDNMNNLLTGSSGSSAINYLPIKYDGHVPEELSKQLDSEAYLEMMYKKLGVQILSEHDRYFYEVTVPEGWTAKVDGYWNYVNDKDGNPILTYFDGGNFYDRDVYVKKIHLKVMNEDDPQKVKK